MGTWKGKTGDGTDISVTMVGRVERLGRIKL